MPSIPVPMLLLAAFAACVIALFLVGDGGRRKAGFRATDYRAKRLLSTWELRALAEIRRDLPSGFVACPQVRLADCVDIVQRDPARRRAALNRVASKSVDFAIIDGAGRVALVIELDDRSHERSDRRQRDRLVAAVLAQSGIPLLRVRPGKPVMAGRQLAGLRLQAAE